MHCLLKIFKENVLLENVQVGGLPFVFCQKIWILLDNF